MSEPRRQFELPAEDAAYLNERGLFWETVVEQSLRWLLVYELPICGGYNVTQADAALQLPLSYPDTQIDMVYFHPHLARADAKPVAQLRNQAFDGKTWQRWSRHRTATNPWRRGFDCIETHLLLVDEWLRREIGRAA